MKENKDILNHLNKRPKPALPKDFFENFSDDLMAKISEDESGLNELHKTTKPDVPAKFFENFAENITSQVVTDDSTKSKSKQSVQVISLKIFGFVSAVAACLLVMFLLNNNNPANTELSDNVNSATSTEEEISDEELLAYFDESDLVDYILEEDIAYTLDEESTTDENTETNNTTSTDLEDLNEEDILYYLQDDIDDIYLDDIEL